MKLKKNDYLRGFIVVTFLLAAVRHFFPVVAERPTTVSLPPSPASVAGEDARVPIGTERPSFARLPADSGKVALGGVHRILSVPDFGMTFPDTNAVQLVAANRWGVTPVRNRSDAEARKKELVYIGGCPYYHVDPLHQSIPYLVPRAAVLLQDIGQAFFDSLHVKGVPLHRFIVTSVLRTEEDVARLRSVNGNATVNSCHLYGTTFDICYNRYETVEAPEGPRRRQVRNDSLKYVLSEVLRDFRNQGRCYVKYEVRQGCFHTTVR